MLKSLALKTNLMMDKHHAVIKEEPEYVFVTTPKRPDYFWGNYVIVKGEASNKTYMDALKAFHKNIGSREDLGFIAITFDWPQFKENLFDEYLKNGFDLSISKVLTCKKVQKPMRVNEEIEVREIDLALDFHLYVDIHYVSDWEYGTDDMQKSFLRDSIQEFRKFSENSSAKRYGAYLNGEAIAELGVYWESGVARFNNVGTHRDFRRLGACSTLVYEVSNLILKKPEVEILVMEADENYHAAAIYESVGFKSTERLASLEWRDRARFG